MEFCLERAGFISALFSKSYTVTRLLNHFARVHHRLFKLLRRSTSRIIKNTTLLRFSIHQSDPDDTESMHGLVSASLSKKTFDDGPITYGRIANFLMTAYTDVSWVAELVKCLCKTSNLY